MIGHLVTLLHHQPKVVVIDPKCTLRERYPFAYRARAQARLINPLESTNRSNTLVLTFRIAVPTQTHTNTEFRLATVEKPLLCATRIQHGDRFAFRRLQSDEMTIDSGVLVHR